MIILTLLLLFGYFFYLVDSILLITCLSLLFIQISGFLVIFDCTLFVVKSRFEITPIVVGISIVGIKLNSPIVICDCLLVFP